MIERCYWYGCEKQATGQVAMRTKRGGHHVARWSLSSPYCSRHQQMYLRGGIIEFDRQEILPV